MARASLTGKFRISPPSTNRRLSVNMGAKKVGMDMLERMASGRNPRSWTKASPAPTSVAMQAKGMGSSRKSSVP